MSLFNIKNLPNCSTDTHKFYFKLKQVYKESISVMKINKKQYGNCLKPFCVFVAILNVWWYE